MGFDWWATEWPVITGAPHIVIGGASALALLLVIVIRWAFSRELSGLKAHLGAKDGQLELARDQNKDLTAKLAEAQSSILALRQEVETRANLAEILRAVNATVRLINDASSASTALGTTLAVSGGKYRTVSTLSGNTRQPSEGHLPKP